MSLIKIFFFIIPPEISNSTNLCFNFTENDRRLFIFKLEKTVMFAKLKQKTIEEKTQAHREAQTPSKQREVRKNAS